MSLDQRFFPNGMTSAGRWCTKLASKLEHASSDFYSFLD
jgi:hypothetical protein